MSEGEICKSWVVIKKKWLLFIGKEEEQKEDIVFYDLPREYF